MAGSDIVFARGDDWEGLYIGGKLLTEGHSIALEHFVEVVVEADGDLTSFITRMVNLDWLDDHGSLPHLLTEVVWEGDTYDAPDYDSDADLRDDGIEF